MLKPTTPNYDLNDVYIGSTTMSLQKRFNIHRAITNKTSSKILFEKYGCENIEICLLEDYPCDNRCELEIREGQHIRSRKCLNKSIAGRKPREYYADNRLECIARVQNWVSANKDHYNAYMKEYMKHYRLKQKLLLLNLQDLDAF